MLKAYRVYATLPVTDFARARAFYKEMLGLTPIEPDGDVYECGEGTRFLFAKMGTRPAGHTQMSFVVDDIATVVQQLKSKGLVFEEYDYPTIKTIDSIADQGDFKGAWFKDSEGNMLGIGQLTPQAARVEVGAGGPQ